MIIVNEAQLTFRIKGLHTYFLHAWKSVYARVTNVRLFELSNEAVTFFVSTDLIGYLPVLIEPCIVFNNFQFFHVLS